MAKHSAPAPSTPTKATRKTEVKKKITKDIQAYQDKLLECTERAYSDKDTVSINELDIMETFNKAINVLKNTESNL